MEDERPDGRSRLDLRPMFLQVGMITDARGSAYIEMGDTKVICSVYGPREIVRRQEYSVSGIIHCEFTFLPFSSKVRNDQQQQQNAKEFSFLLQEALQSVVCLHKFPQSQLDVFVTILQNNGSVLAASITAAGAALVNSQVELYDNIIGCSLRHVGGVEYVDPTSEEEKEPCESNGDGVITVGVLPNKQQLALFLQTGKLKSSELVEATKLLLTASNELHKTVRETLGRKLAKETQDR